MFASSPAEAANRSSVRMRVSGMDCPSCAEKIRTAVSRVSGVSDVDVNFQTETLTFSHEDAQMVRKGIGETVERLGYRVEQIAAPPLVLPPSEELVSMKIGGMDCASCVAKIEAAVGRLSGVQNLSVDFANERMTFTRSADAPSTEVIADKIKALGYVPTIATAAKQVGSPQDHGHGDGHGHEGDHGAVTATADALAPPAWWQSPKGRLVVVSGVLCAAAFTISSIAPTLSQWAFVAAAAIGVVPVARRAWILARSGVPLSIETLMTVATAGALAIGAASEAAVVVFLFAVGEVLEGVAAGRARAGIRGLISLMPKVAWLEIGTEGIQVSADRLQVGQVIRVRPGDRIAADGVIIEGSSDVDDSPVTGESVPKLKGSGERVFAGSINQDAVLRVRVERSSQDNTIARIIRLVEQAQSAKAPTARFIDRFSTYYTPLVVIIAALVVFVPVLVLGQDWATWIYRGLALLLIACPCALVISTPAAIASALAAGARRGLLMKGGAVLEALAHVRVVALDKTGTLTEGRPRVTNLVPFGRTEHEVLRWAAAVETGTSHPIGRAVIALAEAQNVTVASASDVRVVAGKGIHGRFDGQEIVVASPRYAQELVTPGDEVTALVAGLEQAGKTVVVVVAGGAAVGLIAMRDEVRPDALVGLGALRSMGLQAVMLTGDNARPAAAIAAELRIDVRAELMPEDKARIVRELASGGPVAKVGDGINDAPALAAASVGIAMGSGTDVALETADAALLNNRVADIALLVKLARRTMAVIYQNISISIGLKLVFLVTSVMGVTGLWVAIMADTGATVLVTLNALRLLRFGAEEPRR